MPFSNRFHSNALGIYSAVWGNDLSSHTNLSNPYNPPNTYGQCVDPSLNNFFPRRNVLGVSGRDNYVLGSYTNGINLQQNFFDRDINADGVVNITPAPATPGFENSFFVYKNINFNSDSQINAADLVAISAVDKFVWEGCKFFNVKFDIYGNSDNTTEFKNCIFDNLNVFYLGRLQAVFNSPGAEVLFTNNVVIDTRAVSASRGESNYFNSYFQGFELEIQLWTFSGSAIDSANIIGCVFNDNDLILNTSGQPDTQFLVQDCFFNNSEIDFNGTLYPNLQAAATALPLVFGVWQPSTNDTTFGNRQGAFNASFNNSSLFDFSLRYNSEFWRAGQNNENIALNNLGYARSVNSSQGQGVSFNGTAAIGDGLTLVNGNNDYRQTGINNLISDNGFNVFSTSNPYEIDNIELRGAHRLQYDISAGGGLRTGSNTVPHSSGDWRLNIQCKFRCENVSDPIQFLLDYPYYTEISPGIFETNFIKLGFNAKPYYDVVNGVGSGNNLFGSRNVGGVDYYNPNPADLIPIVGEQITTIIELEENTPSNTDIGFQGFTLIFKQNTVKRVDVSSSNVVGLNVTDIEVSHPDESEKIEYDDGVDNPIKFGWGVDYAASYLADVSFTGVVDGDAVSETKTGQQVNINIE